MLEAGGLFGELPLFDDAPRMADAARADRHRGRRAGVRARSHAAARAPELLWVIVRLLVERLRATDEALAELVFLDVPARTAKRLLDLSDGTDSFTLPVTQEELASMVGASARAGQQGHLALRAPRLARPRGPQPLPHHRPPGAGGPRQPLRGPQSWRRAGLVLGGDEAETVGGLDRFGQDGPGAVRVTRTVTGEQGSSEIDAVPRREEVEAPAGRQLESRGWSPRRRRRSAPPGTRPCR